MDSLDHHHHRRPSFFPSMYHTKRQQTTYNNEIKYNLWAKIYSNRVETNIFYSFKNLVSLPLSLFFRYVASAHHFISLARSICVLFVVTVSCHSRKKTVYFFCLFVSYYSLMLLLFFVQNCFDFVRRSDAAIRNCIILYKLQCKNIYWSKWKCMQSEKNGCIEFVVKCMWMYKTHRERENEMKQWFHCNWTLMNERWEEKNNEIYAYRMTKRYIIHVSACTLFLSRPSVLF